MRTTPSRRRSTATIQDGPAFYICVSPNVPFFGEEGLGDGLLITHQPKTDVRVTGIWPYSAASKSVTSDIGNWVGVGIVSPWP